MRIFRFLIIILALVVAGSGMSVDAKKRKTTKRATKAKVVEPAPTNYDYVVASSDESPAFNYDEVKYQPEYPGGADGLKKFLSENIKYPKSAKDKGIQGRVILQFVVEKTGALSNIKVLRSVDPALDKEAVRVVSQITRFVPGYDKDHAPVRVLYTLPVNFILN